MSEPVKRASPCGTIDFAALAARLAVVEESMRVRFEAADKALALQAQIYESRLHNLNESEVRKAAEIKHLQTSYVLIAIHSKDVESLNLRLDELSRHVTLSRGSSLGVDKVIAYVLAVLGLIIGAGAIFLRS